ADAPREVVSVASATVARASWGILDDWIDRPVLAVEYSYAGSDFDAGARLADRLRPVAPLWEEIEPMPYLELQKVGDASWAAGRRRYWKGRLLWDLNDDLLETFASRAELMAGTGCGVELVSLGGKIAD